MKSVSLKWCWWLMLLPLHVWAAPPSADADRKIEQVLELSGMTSSLADLPGLMQEQLQENPIPGVDAEAAVRVGKLVGEVLEPAALRQIMAEELRKHYDAKKFDDYIGILSSPLGRKMAQMEADANTPAGRQALPEFARGLNEKPPAPQRLELIHHLMEVSGSADLVVSMQSGIMESFIRAMNPLVPPERRMDAVQMTQTVQQLKGQMAESAHDFLMLQGLYAYRKAGDKELQDYAALYESEGGRGLATLLNDATLAMFDQIGDKLTKRVVETIH